MDNTEVYIFIAVTLVVLATVSGWLESQLEERDAPDYLRVLRQERRYREHVARGPVIERRRAGKRRLRSRLAQFLAGLVDDGRVIRTTESAARTVVTDDIQGSREA